MQLLGAFLRLIRWPNLFFIALTQVLFYYAVLLPSYLTKFQGLQNYLPPPLFFLLCFSSVLIAAAGYIINDYFDLNIDRVNKPDKLIIEKMIKRRWAIIWHWLLSGSGIIIGFYISWKLRNIFVGTSHVVTVVLLWFYSTTFKRKLLIGNIVISLLTAWVIMVLYLCEFRVHLLNDPAYHHILSRIYKFAVLYAGFAFIISLVREVVKDIEDMHGDAEYNCRTMPIVWGVNVAKVFAATWLTVLILALAILQFYILQYKWWWVVVYSVIFIIIPLVIILRGLYRANTTPDYHQLSSMIKRTMLAGILSLLLFLTF
ncbi:MAG: geranylgeranylglycerol-phosphate geranylgeranyltransferase [Bacteroidetes bacterium]|nr:geranylgeranylglycerol-phosphate geranylgeranyltransferase [Bacteroidota bacterium]MBS1973812.1 geranylgeranylglycerol-phosphate geranylgeranyltransferase [Bacteroidota bacterium]